MFDYQKTESVISMAVHTSRQWWTWRVSKDYTCTGSQQDRQQLLGQSTSDSVCVSGQWEEVAAPGEQLIQRGVQLCGRWCTDHQNAPVHSLIFWNNPRPLWGFIRLDHLCSELVIFPQHLGTSQGLDYWGSSSSSVQQVVWGCLVFLRKVNVHLQTSNILSTSSCN